MFWNKAAFIHTVRFRVALLCAILYILASLFSFLLIFGGRYSAMANRIDPILNTNLDALQCEYLTGQRSGEMGKALSQSDLTREERETLRKAYPDLKFIAAWRSNPDAPCTIAGKNQENTLLLRITRGQRVITRRIDAANHLPLIGRSFRERAAETGRRTIYFRLLDTNGNALADTTSPADETRTPLPWEYRTLRRTNFDGTVFEAGYNRRPFDEQINLYFDRLPYVLLALPLLGFVVGWIAANRLMAGVRRVVVAARHIAGGDYSRRVAKSSEGSEIEELIDTFNLMNSKTEELFTQLRTVTDDVAHDLRTPLTRIRGLAEVTVQGASTAAAYRDALGNIAEECDNMVAMINTTLEIARAESKLIGIEPHVLDATELLRRASDIFEGDAADKGIIWRLNIPDHPVFILGDKLRLQRMIGNLLDNAVKFLSAGQCFTLTLEEKTDGVVITAADTGSGIPPEARQRVFERYFRLDSSRSRHGNGLGLAMVRVVARLHGGDVTVTETSGGGATFTVTLPKQPPETP